MSERVSEYVCKSKLMNEWTKEKEEGERERRDRSEIWDEMRQTDKRRRRVEQLSQLWDDNLRQKGASMFTHHYANIEEKEGFQLGVWTEKKTEKNEDKAWAIPYHLWPAHSNFTFLFGYLWCHLRPAFCTLYVFTSTWTNMRPSPSGGSVGALL